MPKLAYLVAEDYGFLAHRLPVALAARDAGFDVSVITRINTPAARAVIESHGFAVYPISWQRRSINPFAALCEIWKIRNLYRSIQPDIVHHVALKPIIWGTASAVLAGVPCTVNAPTGMGYVFTSNDLLARVLRPILSTLLQGAMRRRRAWSILENPDDLREMTLQGTLSPQRATLIRGCGVETDVYVPLPEPLGPITIGIAARMLHDKGMLPLVAAQQKLRGQGMDVRLLLAGTPDPENRAALSPAEMKHIASLPGVEALGQVQDIRTLWARCHIAVLPSRREGLPKALMEAAACARPLIATNVTGCREVCVDGVNGILVPVDDANALAAAIKTLADNPALRAQYGAESRRIAAGDLSATNVGENTVRLYREILGAK